MSDPIVGIDLGTSNAVVAHADGTGAPQVLADETGTKIHPAVVSFHPGGGVVIGAAAKQRKVIDPQNTIYSVKRLIGRGFKSPEVQTAKVRAPFQIKEGANQLPMISTRAGEFAIPEISAIVLDHMRNIAAARLGTEVSRAVVTVPASFNDAQRSATATAGAIAGLTVVRVLNEPTAAALAYGATRDLSDVIAVYDFGGGTFDVSILKLDAQVYEVLGTAGDTFLGGDDLDERLVDKMVAKFLAEHRVDLRTNAISMMRLRAVAEQTKIELSRRARAVVRVDEIAYGPRGAPLRLEIEISRDEFVRDIAELVDRTFPVCKEALKLAGLTPDRISDVLLVGGTTKIPHVREQASRFFGKAPRADLPPEEAVAAGAALQAASIERLLARPRAGSRPMPAARASDPAEETTETTETETGTTGETETETTLDTIELELEGSAPAPRPASEPTLRRPASEPTLRRPASEPTLPRSETSYSVTRGGTRGGTKDTYDGRAPTSTPPPLPPLSSSSAGAVARGARPPTPPPTPPPPPPLPLPPPLPPPLPTAAPGSKTMFGVPQGPAAVRPARVIGAGAGPASATLDIPTLHPGIEPGIGAGSTPTQTQPTVPRAPRAPNPSSWSDADDLVRPPPPPPGLASPVPSAPPSAKTMLAPAEPAPARGPGRPPSVIIDEEMISPGSTARGYAAPATAGLFVPATAGLSAPAAAGLSATAAPTLAAPTLAAAAAAAPPRPPTVLEVTPRGLGIGTVAGFCEELIHRNSRVPAETKKLFTTSRDRQDVVRIVVCQGESRRLESNVVIGDLVLQGLPPRPRGETSIEVTFSLDASGILQVHARDAATGAEQRARIDLLGGMQPQDIAVSRDRLQHLRR